MSIIYKVEEVFGVSKDPILSYIERSDVDGMFLKALRTDKQIIVYGASKQGKTSLVEKHLPYKDNIMVSLTPKFMLVDIYKSILNSLGVELDIGSEQATTSSTHAEGSANVNAKFPFFGGAEAGMSASENKDDSMIQKRSVIPLNLELPNDVAVAYKKVCSKKLIILENFHYLDEEIQKQFAFDLRSFQELGVRFIILGVWREKNRLIQFNGDLLDRVFEVPVEPWAKLDFEKVVKKGSAYLNINFSEKLIDSVVENAFDSIGVVQELLKALCYKSGVDQTQKEMVVIESSDHLREAKLDKVESYSARHLRALEAIAEGRKVTNLKSDDAKEMPLYLPYYTVRAILEFNFEDIVNGIKRSSLEQKIKGIHHRPDDVRASDMSNLLYNLAKLQSEKSISPPIFDFGKTTQTIRVIDSTFYFFLRNANLREILKQIPNPTERGR